VGLRCACDRQNMVKLEPERQRHPAVVALR
jgi:hypothetical protein